MWAASLDFGTSVPEDALGIQGPEWGWWMRDLRVRRETGEVQQMQVLYGEGIAYHAGLESCAAVREGRGEALTGGRAGWVLSREITRPGSRRRPLMRKAKPARRHGETRQVPARSETPRMSGSTSRGNREVPGSPTVDGTGGRSGKPKGASR